MEKHKNASVWIEEGYRLMSHEGVDGIQVERLARILQLNKSGFYHYFGDLEGFCVELITLHKKKVSLFLNEVAEITTIDPEYLTLLIKYATMVMVQVQFTRNPSLRHFYSASEWADQKINIAVRKLWSDYLDVPCTSDLSLRYYAIIRDRFYTRITFQKLNYAFLHELFTEAKLLIDEIIYYKALEIDKRFA